MSELVLTLEGSGETDVEVWETTDGLLELQQNSDQVRLDDGMREQLRAYLSGEDED